MKHVLPIFMNPTAAQKRMTIKRYEARRENVNALLELYMKNNIQYKTLNESVGISKMSQISDKDLNEMTIFHAVEEPQAAAKVTSDQSNVRRIVIFEEDSNADEELLIHQEGFYLLPMKQCNLSQHYKWHILGCRCTAVRQFCSVSDPNLFAK